MDAVLEWLQDFRYLAMFGILFLCGVGLPVPEEVTLVGSGLLVGWGRASFLWASLACVLGILAGDSIIFGLGYYYGRQFLLSRPMRLLIPARRQLRVASFFARHGWKAVFFARFFALVRMGVYAYAGSQKMPWWKFLLLDLMGALISGPTSIFLGAVVARIAGDPEEAEQKALEAVHRFGIWLLLGALLIVAALVGFQVFRRRRRARAEDEAATPPNP